MGYRVIDIDLMNDALEEARDQGAEHTFNPRKQPDYITQIKSLTNGGCHAAVNFTAAKAAYDSSPAILRTNGILTVVDIPSQPISFDALTISNNSFRVRSGSNSIPQQLPELVKFTADHSILPHITFYKLEQINKIVELLKSAKTKRRLAMKF